MNLNNLRFSFRSSVKALLLFYLAIALISCAGTRAYKPPSFDISGKTNIWQISVNKSLSRITSYSSISGQLKSEPDDYVEITNKGPITFFGHKDHLDAAKTVLNKPCCHDGKTTADNIVKAVQWSRSLLNLDYDMLIEVFLVPDAYNYHYVTRHKITKNQAKVRFAYHYYDDRPVPEAYFIESIVDSLTHELTHAYFRLSGNPAKNMISEETTASAVGACAQTLVTQRFPITVTRIKFVNAEDEDILPEFRKTEYPELISKLKDNLPATIIGQILTTLLVEKVDDKYGHSEELASEKMREFCQHIVTTRHDFETSMGLEE